MEVMIFFGHHVVVNGGAVDFGHVWLHQCHFCLKLAPYIIGLAIVIDEYAGIDLIDPLQIDGFPVGERAER